MHFTQPIATVCRDGDAVVILDQTVLPHRCETRRLSTLDDVAQAIRQMQVRGAPLIGVTAAFGMAMAMRDNGSDKQLRHAIDLLAATRPTAVNLHWALARMQARLAPLPAGQRSEAAWDEAGRIRAGDQQTCAAIGEFGLAMLLEVQAARSPDQRDLPIRVLTHCNAGWLATLGAGTALAPVYAAQARGVPVHVWVSETRPRNQGLLTAWELRQAGVAHTLIADNAAGILLARGEVDVVVTGADRVAANGDSANKVGTYLKALAARDNSVPFYIAAPMSTVDFSCANGAAIPIEDRGGAEVRGVEGLDDQNAVRRLLLALDETHAVNPAFDVTPARLITGIITEFGVYAPEKLKTLQGRQER